MTRKAFVSRTKAYVTKVLSVGGRKPSKATVNSVAAKIVKSFESVVITDGK